MAEYMITEKGMRMLEGVREGEGNTLIDQVLPSVDPSITAQLFSYLEALGTQGGTINDSDLYSMAQQYGIDSAQIRKLVNGALIMGLIKRVDTGWRNT